MMETKAAVKFESVWLPENNATEGSIEKDTETDVCVKSEPTLEDNISDGQRLVKTGPEAGEAQETEENRLAVTSSTEGGVSVVPGQTGPYSCELCGAVFQKLHDIAEHIESYCGKRPFKCKQCGRRLSDFSTHKHMRNPVKEALYGCDICQRTFLHLGTLARHKRTHIMKPHKCEFCGKKFVKRSGLLCHRRSYKGLEH